MPKERKITAKLSRPMVIPDAAFKLLAEEFVEWYEREGYKKYQDKQNLPDDPSEQTPKNGNTDL